MENQIPPRYFLTHISTSAAGIAWKVINENFLFLKPWIPWTNYVTSLQACEKWISSMISSKQNATYCAFFIIDTTPNLPITLIKGNETIPFVNWSDWSSCSIIGMLSLYPVQPVKITRTTEFGYWISEKYSRKGISKRSVQDLICSALNPKSLLWNGWGSTFLKENLHKFKAKVDIKNIASQKLLLSLGFRLECTLRQTYWDTPPGPPKSLMVFAGLVSELNPNQITFVKKIEST